MKTDYSYVILGCGGLGSGAVYWLARRAGSEVLGLEQFALGHPNGGSHDHSRIIRKQYDQVKYTRLASHAYETWAVLEEESAVKVVVNTGGIHFAFDAHTAHRRALDNYAAAMDAVNIPYEWIDGDEVMRRWPQFQFDEPVTAMFQADTGLVDARRANAAHVATARYHGATILDHTHVQSIHPFDGGVDVQTDRGTFTCGKLIVTAGPWADRVLADVGISLSLTVTQEQLTYYATPNLREFAVGRFPIFMVDGPDWLYGFPVYGEVATKIAIDAAGPVVATETRTFDPDPERERRAGAWLKKYIPGFLGPVLYTKTCLYDMPRDRNFVIDALPEYPQILVCCGASHGFKFASLFGKILSELAVDGRTDYPLEPFTIRRPAITDPNFAPDFGVDRPQS